MEVKQKVEIPSLAVMLVIDRSGSMAMGMKDNDKINKLEVAKESAHLVVDLLDERNEVGVLSFDTEFVWHVPIQPAKNKQAIHREISAIKAGGGTDGYPAVREGYRALFDRDALLKHVIFLSDGQMTRGDFAGLIRRMVKDKITVSGVAIGSDADVQLMNDVSKWGRGRFYFTEETSTVPRIFTLETQLASKASLIEQPFKAIVTGPAPRGDPGHRLAEGAAPRRLRRDQHQGHRRPGPHDPPGGPAAGGLALRAGPVGGLHGRRQGEVGHPLAPVGVLQQVLGPGGPLDAPREHAQRHHGHAWSGGTARRS